MKKMNESIEYIPEMVRQKYSIYKSNGNIKTGR